MTKKIIPQRLESLLLIGLMLLFVSPVLDFFIGTSSHFIFYILFTALVISLFRSQSEFIFAIVVLIFFIISLFTKINDIYLKDSMIFLLKNAGNIIALNVLINRHQYIATIVNSSLPLIFSLLGIFFLINALTIFIGIGYPTYLFSSNWGHKGFFQSANELANSISILTVTICIRQFKYSGLIIIACLISLIILGTKSGLLTLIIVSAILLWRSNFLVKIGYITILAFGVFYIAFYFDPWIEKNTWVLENRGILSLIFSGRHLFVEGMIEATFYDDFSILLGGLSLEEMYVSIGKYLVEIDFFDLFFLAGLPLVFLWVSIFVRLYRGGSRSTVVQFLITFVLALSFLPGHMLYSSLAIPMFFFCYVWIIYGQTKNISHF